MAASESSVSDKLKKEREILQDLIAFYGQYHNHKEQMAFSIFGLEGAFFIGLFLLGNWPQSIQGMDRTLLARCQPWRAKRRLVDPSSREAALFSRRALRQRENKVGLRTRRPVIGSQVRSSNELAKLLRSAG